MPIPENVHTLPAVTYEPVPEQGLSPVLDIGGGGEGVVGLLCEGVCVSVDRDASELAEAPEGPLKIVSDATTLPFLDGSFPRARAFFSFMYMEETTKAAVLDEVFRVLTPGASLLIEDLRVDDDYPAEIVLQPLTLVMPDGVRLETGYGCRWEGKYQDALSLAMTAERAGFYVLASQDMDALFRLQLEKPGVE